MRQKKRENVMICCKTFRLERDDLRKCNDARFQNGRRNDRSASICEQGIFEGKSFEKYEESEKFWDI